MKWMFLLLFLIPSIVTAQNVVVVKTDTAEIKAEAKEDSRTLRIVEKGTQLEYSGTINGWVILIEGGFIPTENVATIEAFTIQGGKIIDEETIIKEPAEYTEKELLYLLLQEQKKNQATRKEITTIKNIQVAFAALSAISIVISIVQLSKL